MRRWASWAGGWGGTHTQSLQAPPIAHRRLYCSVPPFNLLVKNSTGCVSPVLMVNWVFAQAVESLACQFVIKMGHIFYCELNHPANLRSCVSGWMGRRGWGEITCRTLSPVEPCHLFTCRTLSPLPLLWLFPFGESGLVGATLSCGLHTPTGWSLALWFPPRTCSASRKATWKRSWTTGSRPWIMPLW